MWNIFIDILNEKDAAHSDLAQLAISLINKVIATYHSVRVCIASAAAFTSHTQ